MICAGLTGGIASGKSLAAKYFKRCGAYLVDADSISREVVRPSCQGWQRIVDSFGTDVLMQGENIDRRKLGSIVFSDAGKRQILNNLLHPLIIEKTKSEIDEIAAAQGSCVIVVEMPLLIECGLQNDFDKIVLVCAGRHTQIKRLMERRSLKADEAERMLNSQMSIDKKREYACYVIENEGSKSELEKEVAAVYGFLKNDMMEKERVLMS